MNPGPKNFSQGGQIRSQGQKTLVKAARFEPRTKKLWSRLPDSNPGPKNFGQGCQIRTQDQKTLVKAARFEPRTKKPNKVVKPNKEQQQ